MIEDNILKIGIFALLFMLSFLTFKISIHCLFSHLTDCTYTQPKNIDAPKMRNNYEAIHLFICFSLLLLENLVLLFFVA